MNGQRPKTPYVYRLVRDASGQSETFGVILLLGITVVGTTAIIALGSQALTQTESAGKLQRTEHTMTLLDSRSAMVAMGESDMQTVTFSGGGSANFSVNEDTGYIKIVHANYSENDSKEVLYNESLGHFKYKNGDTEIAYQGGGVWRTVGNDTLMVSQPEFHYRGQTLTFPIVQIKGNGNALGRTTVTVRNNGDINRVFPNTSGESDGVDEVGVPYNVTQKQYVNPVQNGSVFVWIHSEYYKGWAKFFRGRTTTEVTEYDSNNTVRIELLTPSVLGDFEMPAEGSSVTVAGMGETHDVDNYTVNLKVEGNKFKQAHWSMWAEQGNEKFEIHVRNDNNKCDEVEDGDEPLSVSIFYTNGTGNHEWQNTSVKNHANSMLESVECSGSLYTVRMNFTEPTNLTYGDISGVSSASNKWYFGDQIKDNSPKDPLTFDDHPADTSETYSVNDVQNSSYLINHYMALLAPSFDLTVQGGPGNSNRINEDESSGSLDYEQTGQKYITYLHVTEREIEMEVG
jgi:hypothetical protein